MAASETRPKSNPVSRPVDGALAYDKFDNLNPERHYLLADPHVVPGHTSGVNWYEGLGYEVERVRKDGPRARVGGTRADGTEISVLGLVLMSCPRDLWLARKQEGQHEVDEQVRGARRPLEAAGLRSGHGMTFTDTGSGGERAES